MTEPCSEIDIFSRAGDLFEVIPLASHQIVHLAFALPKQLEGKRNILPRSSLPKAGRIAAGRGLSFEQARLSCLGEAAELASACLWGDEPLSTASYLDVGGAGLHPANILMVSDEQYGQRSEWNSKYGDFDWIPERLDEGRPIEWIEVTSPGGMDRTLIPAACAFIGYFEPKAAGAFAVADSSGCAAGATLEEATIAAFLEIVERDATALWWYGGHLRPAADMSNTPTAAKLVESLKHGRRVHVIDVTSDLKVPVFVAISAEQDGSAVAMGAAADFDAERAMLSALTEMVQTEFSLAVRKSTHMEGIDAFRFWLDHVTLKNFPHLAPAGVVSHTTAGRECSFWPATVETCTSLARNSGLEMFALNLTRPQIGVPVVRVIMPGMRTTRYRLADGRLNEVPSKLGWCNESTCRNPNKFPLLI